MSKSDKQNNFYWSKEWRKLREYIMKKYNYICQSCGKPAKIVHHIVWINDNNIDDVSVTLNEENLTALCQECHNQIHTSKGSVQEGLMFNNDGDLVKLN
ncbi:HNH endonuclease [Tuanshanicoccus lijuaniae]|uniref:HNH endonuclease n=1 Tax=Aerococcaceae bacterium zg-1292 TaxID=2774330 RepID=UPI0019365A5F|nr:HNH endonuclease [Aerococcaceae bacterium zg-1292]MBS4456316.1 HNH endonuclease [Aerococcaceae bacterium zg-A91]MBS4458097.1 HNH endonuclease [Aerococcaceae bacterium zg-BR33]MBS4458751.1 HNH endonuclease [Aerococcaceae bacterium zg-BR33]QQA37532.1 HNH endonuclease [Aerococcaceae bacterium zg-1292]